MPLSDVATAGVSGAASSLAGGLMGLVAGRLNYKYNKKLMAQQNAYNIAAFNREMAGQKELSEYMAKNANLWQKMSLQNAGYSTADPNGSGVSAQSVSAPNQDVPSMPNFTGFNGVAEGVLGGLDTALKAAQIKNINADTNKKTTENEQMKLELQNYRDTYDERVGRVRSEYYNLTKENKRLDAEIDRIGEVTRGLEIDNNFNAVTFDKRKEQLLNEVSLLMKENKIKEVEQKLAENGIVIGMNDIQSLVSVAEFGKTEHLVDVMGQLVADFCKELPVAIKAVFEGLWEGAKSMVGLGNKK